MMDEFFVRISFVVDWGFPIIAAGNSVQLREYNQFNTTSH
jgi:hypothetical protein